MDDTSLNVTVYFLYFPPAVVTGPSTVDIDFAINTEVTLTCPIEGFPLPSFEWSQAAANSDSFSSVAGENSSQLVLADVSDSGRYRCVGSNEINGTSHNTQITFNLIG